MTNGSLQRTLYLMGPEQVEMRSGPIAAPGAGEMRVRIQAAMTCGTDVKVYRRGGHPKMLVAPTPFGHEMAGRVEELGEGVTTWEVGDEVILSNSSPCRICEFCQVGRENLCTDLHYLNGAYSDTIIVPPRFVERSVYCKPAGLPMELAPIAEPLACVVHGLDTCALDRSHDVLVVGGGPIGLLFVNLLSVEGHRVTLADPNRARLDTALALGAAQVFEAHRDGRDSTQVRSLAENGAGFSVVIEATGSPVAWQNAIASVRIGGLVLLFGGCAKGTTVPLDTHLMHYSELTMRGAYHHRPATFARAIELLAEGRLQPQRIISGETHLDGVEEALRSMMRRETLKMRVLPG